jgi:hypothetical protein
MKCVIMSTDKNIAAVTDNEMKQMLATSKIYTLVFLKSGVNYDKEGIQPVIWEHGRRNFQLRARGLLSIVGPITDESEIKGIYIFNATEEKTKNIMEDDPAVLEGIFVYETHPMRSFPGESLPE